MWGALTRWCLQYVTLRSFSQGVDKGGTTLQLIAILALVGSAVPATADDGAKLEMKGRLICTAKFEDRVSKRYGNVRIRRPYQAEFDLDAMTVAEQGATPRKIKFTMESLFDTQRYFSYEDDVKSYITFVLGEERMMKTVAVGGNRIVFADCRRPPVAM